jgi:hypothetical protein
VNIDDVVIIGIRVLINGSSVLLENEKINKNILKNEWKLIDVTLSTFVIIMIYVPVTYEIPRTYMTLYMKQQDMDSMLKYATSYHKLIKLVFMNFC